MSEHTEKYEQIAQQIGIEQLIDLVPEKSHYIKQLLNEGDEHLNGIPLKKWDNMDFYVRSLAAQKGINFWSLSMTVCTLKHVAKFHMVK